MNINKLFFCFFVFFVCCKGSNEVDDKKTNVKINQNDFNHTADSTIPKKDSILSKSNFPYIDIDMDDFLLFDKKVESSNFMKEMITRSDSTKYIYHEVLDDTLFYTFLQNSYITFYNKSFYDFKIRDKGIISFNNYSFDIDNSYFNSHIQNVVLHVESIYINNWDNHIEMTIKNNTITEFYYYIPT